MKEKDEIVHLGVKVLKVFYIFIILATVFLVLMLITSGLALSMLLGSKSMIPGMQ